MVQNDWNANVYDQKFGFVAAYGKNVLSLLDPQPGEMILDLGCGTGHLANELAQAGAQVIGIDGSPRMIEVAQASYPQLTFQVADARHFSFPYQFDAIFSNATLHWIPDAEDVVRSMVAALKPGGRLVFEMGGKGNVKTITDSLQTAIKELTGHTIEHGWFFPSIGEYAPLLERYGLAVHYAQLFERPTPLDGETGLRNWIHMFADRMLDRLTPDQQEQALTRMEELARPRLFQQGRWIADYWRLRMVAYKEMD